MVDLRNLQIAGIFLQMADLLEIKGENPFKARAYRTAAERIQALPVDIKELRDDRRIREVLGVGEALEQKIGEWLDSGRIAGWEKLKSEVPSGLLALLEIPGVGPKTAATLFRELGVRSIADLEAAVSAQRIRSLRGLGARAEANIARGLQTLKSRTSRMLLGVALPLAKALVCTISRLPVVHRVSVAGSVRRGCETVGNIDLVVATSRPESLFSEVGRLPGVKSCIPNKGGPLASGDAPPAADGPSGDAPLAAPVGGSPGDSPGDGPGDSPEEEALLPTWKVLLDEGGTVRVAAVTPPEYFPALRLCTGSRVHNRQFSELAKRKGLSGGPLWGAGSGANPPLGAASEEAIFRLAGLDYIPPELREGTGEIEAAAQGSLPALITLRDIKGDLHVHSSWSDGTHSLREIARAAGERGLEYAGVTDHSRSLVIARGLSEERLMAQMEEIERINTEGLGARLLTGMEVDIHADGSLDFDDEVLERLDVVVASVHTGFRQDPHKLTARLIRAIENPHVDIVGHLSGRILNRREPYDLDLEAIFDAAARTGTALEINSSPDRLDLSDRSARMAMERGACFVVSTDAHGTDQLGFIDYGVIVARRAWLTPAHVLNTRPAEKLFR